MIRGGLEGRERLRVVGRVMRPTTCSLLERVGIPEGGACLDVGCGGGDATCELARMVGPRGRAVGVDLDAAKIELAREEAAARGLAHVEFRVAPAAGTVDDDAFDAVYLRFLLTHLVDPSEVLLVAHRQLRPRGVVVVEDIDFTGHFCHPESRAFTRYVELYTDVVRRRGADANIGPRLPGLLRACGYVDVAMNVVQPAGIDGEVKVIAALTMENIADAVLAEGLASRDEIGEVIRELYAVAADGSTAMSVPRIVQAWGRRAPDPGR